MSEVKEAMNILRKHMQDKSEGELYHSWMCNIKFAVYDKLMSEELLRYDHPMSVSIDKACEEGAKIFLDRLLEKEE